MTPWTWWAGEIDEDTYGLAEAATREDAIREASQGLKPGDKFRIVEARASTAARHEGSDCVPFLRTRNHEIITVGRVVVSPAPQTNMVVSEEAVRRAACAIWQTWQAHKQSEASWEDAEKAYLKPHEFPKLYEAHALALDEARAALMAGLSTPPPEHHLEGAPAGLKPIPIEAAKRIAKEYGYDQVLIYARRCHDTPEPHGEHMTTYGRNREHCDVAARIGDTLKKFMGWEV